MASLEASHSIAPYATPLDHLRDELARIDLLVRSQVARAKEAAGGEIWRGLAISDAEMDGLLARLAGEPPWEAAASPPTLEAVHDICDGLAEQISARAGRTSEPSRLGALASRFGLDRFALDVVLLALAPELDLRYERFYAYLQDDVTRKRPTVELVMHLLCRSAEARFAARAYFTGTSSLVADALLHLVSDVHSVPLLSRTLKLDDRIVDWLHGMDEVDTRLARHTSRYSARTELDDLVPDRDTRDVLARSARADPRPVVYVQGPAGVGKTTAACAWATAIGKQLLVLDCRTLEGIPDAAAEAILVIAAREAKLANEVLLIKHADTLFEGSRPGVRAMVVALAALMAPELILAGSGPCPLVGNPGGRALARVQLPLPDARQQEQFWREALNGTDLADDVALDVLTGTLRLAPGHILDAVTTARNLAQLRGASEIVAMRDIVEACRQHSSQRFGSFARKIAARPGWDDLVLPRDRIERLREAVNHARHRAQVLETWGFERRLHSGKGLGMLFTGAPGTGKTLAASVIATELGLDLYQIDLASVVSKWVGETEKHLAKIFDEAERGHGVLLFDEADALFGKRTELHDAHDRYANIETSYLLQRIEDYAGIVILTTNFRRNLDDAFVRRLRFIVEFPMPDAADRLTIWQRIWPAEAPLQPDLDLGLMARKFELTGAHIRNIALAASFLAAADRAPISQRHLLHAARREYQKLGKIVDEAQFRA